MEALIIGGATIVSGLLGLVAQIAARARRENNRAHDHNLMVLQTIDRRTTKMDDKLDQHGEWIAGHDAWHGATDPPDQKWKSRD